MSIKTDNYIRFFKDQVEEIKKEYLEGLEFHYVRTNEQVLDLALEK